MLPKVTFLFRNTFINAGQLVRLNANFRQIVKEIMGLQLGTPNVALASSSEKLGLEVADLQPAYETSQIMAMAESSGMPKYLNTPRVNDIWRLTKGLLLQAIKVEILPIKQTCAQLRILGLAVSVPKRPEGRYVLTTKRATGSAITVVRYPLSFRLAVCQKFEIGLDLKQELLNIIAFVSFYP